MYFNDPRPYSDGPSNLPDDWFCDKPRNHNRAEDNHDRENAENHNREDQNHDRNKKRKNDHD